MLYTVVSPLIFFLSFAGIILVVSRVVLRSRRVQFSQAVRVVGEAGTRMNPEAFLHTGNNSVQLIKSRLGLLLPALRRTGLAMKHTWHRYFLERAEKKAAAHQLVNSQAPKQTAETQGVVVPAHHWSQPIVFRLKKIPRTVFSFVRRLQEQVKKRLPVPAITSVVFKEQAVVDMEVMPERPKTQIRIMRVETPDIVVAGGDNNEQALAQGVEGRFIARLKKAQAPKSSVVEQAIAAISGLQYDKAEEILVPYLADHTKDTQAYMLLGKVAVARQRWEEASEIFQQVVSINPVYEEAQANLGLCALNQGKFTLAIQALQKAHQEDPQNTIVLKQLLAIARRMDNRILQKSVLQQLAELEPDNDQVAKDLQRIKQA